MQAISKHEPEDIPNEHQLYMRAHKMYFFPIEERLNPGVFRDHEGAMSTDWSEYCTPQQTQARARQPSDNAVIALLVGGVREIPGQQVLHTPQDENRAHTDVRGDKQAKAGDGEEVRVKFLRLVEIVLPLSPPPLSQSQPPPPPPSPPRPIR